MGIKTWVLSLSLVILFSAFIFSFAGLFLQSSNPTSEVLSSKYGLDNSTTKLNEKLDEFSTVSNNVYSDLGGSIPSATDYLFLIFAGAFYIPYAFLSFSFGGLTTMIGVLLPSLAGTGLGTVVGVSLGVLFSAMLITVVLLIVRAIRTGYE